MALNIFNLNPAVIRFMTGVVVGAGLALAAVSALIMG